ncbi:MAG: hypothetical protein LR015_05125 [Verrucomicrobia bacterium]|nr:hypothetical protein [Verrucomicrobiota bacterium]
MANILIIDPASGVREALSAVLSPMGFKVFTAGDCKDAAKQCKAERIDIVLADLSNGGMDLADELQSKKTGHSADYYRRNTFQGQCVESTAGRRI